MIAAHKKIDFINQLSYTFGSGGLTCSFADKELTQYVSWKRRKFHNNEHMLDKGGVLQLGRQPCGNIWILSEDCFINKEGQISTDHNYVWLKNLSSFGTSPKDHISLDEISCNVIKPLSITTLPSLVTTLEKCLEHNFLSAVLFMGAGAMIFHYCKILELFKFCPQIMAVGPPSTGKTISLQASLALFGANNSKNHYNSCSKAYCLQRCAMSTIPFGIDDPNCTADISDIILCLYNGTISANIAQGGVKPLSCPLYCANFNFGSNERYVS